MKTRVEAAKFISGQLDGTIKPYPHSAWHYGKCELWQLMDFIYEGPPATDEEYVGNPAARRLRNCKAGKWT